MSAPAAQAPLLQRPLRRIAVFRALYLGDLLCAVPALRALRAAAPDAHIALVGLPWARVLVERYRRYVDELIEYPGGEALADNTGPEPPGMNEFHARMRARQFDLALQLHGDGSRSNAVVERFGAALCAGFYPPDAAAPSAHHLPWVASEPEVHRWLRLLEHLGAPPERETLDFPLTRSDRDDAAALLARGGIRRPYLCLHAGARLHSRRWPATRYALVARELRAQGWPLVLTGSAGEAGIAALIAQAAVEPPWAPQRPPLLDLSGRTSLGALGAVVEGATALICNDTGVSHVATALGTPSVVVSCGGDAQRWAAPTQQQQQHTVLAAAAPCRPCGYDHCPNGHVCALAVGVGDVLAALRPFLSRRRPHAA